MPETRYSYTRYNQVILLNLKKKEKDYSVLRTNLIKEFGEYRRESKEWLLIAKNVAQ